MVLLILAGITITMIVSDDGIIKYAQSASDKANKAQQDTLKGIDKISNDLSDPYVEIPSNSSGNGTASDIEDYEQLKILGSEVLYEPDDPNIAQHLKASGIRWLLFYAGNKFSRDSSYQFYLIASDPIPISLYPSAVDQEGNKTYKFPEICQRSGSDKGVDLSPVCSSYAEGLRMDRLVYAPLNLGSLPVNSSLEESAAYLTDPLAWSIFENEYSEYCAGATSLPLFLASYKQKYGQELADYTVVKDSMYGTYLFEEKYWFSSMATDDSSKLSAICIQQGDVLQYTSSSGTGHLRELYKPIICLKKGTRLEFSLDGTLSLSW